MYRYLTKEQLRQLIDKMNADENVHRSKESISWKAYREAEKLTDTSLLPVVQEIIEENRKDKQKNVRQAAYFIFGNILKNSFDKDACIFLINQLRMESDKYIVSSMLDLVANLEIPTDVDIEPIISLSRSDKWLIRYSAIRALGSSKTKESKDALTYYLVQSDEKQFKDEIIYANASLGKIGDKSNIPLLEKHVHSQIRDVKESAQFAIERMKQKM